MGILHILHREVHPGWPQPQHDVGFNLQSAWGSTQSWGGWYSIPDSC